ncbi:hypothetical protein B0T26DRAFT_638396 [Lasiosphaeria miniovina]|uniref:Uncharacterized protein n=1 Tax=Lasiosphaeria miniovina TaxID=1954250 RepID=A0AA40B3S5_9PEZI|nr:uncharacterized protein B0T26DRAFT_638396 [Lasiosphaeria miniovina]KAK0727111.1 hypothetical protein B0T26DRAFT_638396 [Lasiosphaeria miniovina]
MRAAAMRTVTRRQFSMIQSMRSFARSFESHPFERLPASTPSHALDWSLPIKGLAKKSALYFPFMGVFLGWPLVAATVADGHIQ